MNHFLSLPHSFLFLSFLLLLSHRSLYQLLQSQSLLSSSSLDVLPMRLLLLSDASQEQPPLHQQKTVVAFTIYTSFSHGTDAIVCLAVCEPVGRVVYIGFDKRKGKHVDELQVDPGWGKEGKPWRCF